MIKWHKHKKLHPIYTSDPDYGAGDIITLSDNLSPMTNLLLNTSINAIDSKNIIIVVPDIMLRPLPLLSYFYSRITDKSTLVFTQKGKYVKESPIELHRKNYYVLNWGDYLFYDIPIGIISGDKLESKVFLPRKRNQNAWKRVIKQQKINFQDKRKPKILLYSDNDGNRLIKSIKSIILDESKITENIDIKIGTIIFENVDRFIYSDYTADCFLKWLKDVISDDINLIFHFSNPQSRFINYIKENTNSLVIPGNNSLLKNNNELKNQSLNYFNSEKNKINIKLLNKYNLDLIHFYKDEGKQKILKPLLESGNIDNQFKSAYYLSKKVDETKLVNKSKYYYLRNVLYELINLVVNPSKYKCLYDFHGVPRTLEINQIMDDFALSLDKEKSDNRLILESFLSEIYSIYEELSRCDRYFQKGVFSRVAKDYKLLEFAEKMRFKDEKIVFVTFSPFEKTLLKEDFKKLNLEFLEIENIDWISHRYFDRSLYKIVLPGPLKNKNLSEIFMPYKEIIFLSYSGANFNEINKQLKYINEYSVEEERVSLAYIKEIHEFLNENISKNLFIDFKKREKQLLENKIITVELVDDKSMNPFERIKNKILISSSNENDHDETDIVEKKIKELHQDFIDLNMETECIKFNLRNIGDNRIYLKELPLNKTYFYLKTIGGKIEEATPKNLRENYLVVILDNDEKKSLLELIIDIFGLEEGINKFVIEYWKESLILDT